MSGHSKWSGIKRDKAINDAKRSKIFTKVSKALTQAAKKGSDPDMNPALRLALEKAREGRMPKDAIERAIAKGAGSSAGGTEFDEITYEGFGPSGEGFYIKALTDNRNRTVAEIRNVFSKLGGSLGNSGSTAYIFAADPENPTYTVEVDEDQSKKLIQILEELEELDDVQDVYFNFDLK